MGLVYARRILGSVVWFWGRSSGTIVDGVRGGRGGGVADFASVGSGAGFRAIGLASWSCLRRSGLERAWMSGSAERGIDGLNRWIAFLREENDDLDRL